MEIVVLILLVLSAILSLFKVLSKEKREPANKFEAVCIILALGIALIGFRERRQERDNLLVKENQRSNEVQNFRKDNQQLRKEVAAARSENVVLLKKNLDLIERLGNALATNRLVDSAIREAYLEGILRTNELVDVGVLNVGDLVGRATAEEALHAIKYEKRLRGEDDETQRQKGAKIDGERPYFDKVIPVWEYFRNSFEQHLAKCASELDQTVQKASIDTPSIVFTNIVLGNVWVGTNSALKFEYSISRGKQGVRAPILQATETVDFIIKSSNGVRTMLVTLRGETVEIYLWSPNWDDLPKRLPLKGYKSSLDSSIQLFLGLQFKDAFR